MGLPGPRSRFGEGDAPLALGPQEHRRSGGPGLLPGIWPRRDADRGTGKGVPGALGGGGVLCRGQGRGRSGPLRGEEVGGLVPSHNPLPARPRLPGRHPSGRRRRVRKPKKGDLDPNLIPPTGPEVRRLVLAMAEPEEQRRFLFGWSASPSRHSHKPRFTFQRPPLSKHLSTSKKSRPYWTNRTPRAATTTRSTTTS